MKELRYTYGGPPVKLKRTKKLQKIIIENNGPIPFVIEGEIITKVKFDRTKTKRIKITKK